MSGTYTADFNLWIEQTAQLLRYWLSLLFQSVCKPYTT